MSESPDQRIRRPISLWLNMNSLPTVHSKDKEAQTNDKMTPNNQDVKGSQSKDNQALCFFVMDKVPNTPQKDMGPSI